MKVTGRRPVRSQGALGGINRGVNRGVGNPEGDRPVQAQPQPRPQRQVARGVRQHSVNDRPPRRSTMGNVYGARRGVHSQTPPPPHPGSYGQPPHHHHHHGGRRRGNCISYFAALIVMLVIVFLVFFGDEIKAKVFNDDTVTTNAEVELKFRNDSLLNDHYNKHGIDMGFTSAQSYQEAAAKVVENSASLHKKEAEDGDDVYYLESTNEFVIVAKDGYIRTYFCPEDGIEYYNRQ